VAETIGAIIFASVEAAGVTGAAAAGATVIGAGITVNAAVGAAAIIGTSIGLQYALAVRPSLPSPEDGSQPLKQSIPPRIKGYGRCRLGGYYMLFERGASVAPAASYDCMAYHSGRIDQFVSFFLHDDYVSMSGDISHGGIAYVLGTYADARYGGNRVSIETAIGLDTQAASALLTSDAGINAVWTSDFRGQGIAWAAMVCSGVNDPALFTKNYPHGLPVLSVVADCSPVFDPRDVSQSRSDPSTWKISYNPVIQLIDFITNPEGGLGEDYDVVVAPQLSRWITEANVCDVSVPTADGGTEPRYQANGWFQYDNKPEDVIGALLASCDGWLAEAGDGSIGITVGLYRAPSDPPLTLDHITGFSLDYGVSDEETVNQLEISYTDPAQKYVQIQTVPVRDEASIAAIGAVRSQPLDLKWVQSNAQARRLGVRAMNRLSGEVTGTFTTGLYGLRYLGKRWVPIQYPFVAGLENCVVEIQDSEVDLLAGSITWKFLSINPDSIESYNAAVDEGPPPTVPVPSGT
jgi:hypothetical protein